MKKYLVSAVIISTVLMMPMAAAQSQNSTGNPGLVGPDSPIYGLETAWDNAAVGIGLKTASSVAKERVAEANAMAEKNNTRGMQRAAEQFGPMAERAINNNETGINQSIQKMEELAQNAPTEEARQGMNTALQNMREAGERRNGSMRGGPEGMPGGGPESPMDREESPETGDNEDQVPDSPETDGTDTPDEDTADTDQDQQQTSPDTTTERTAGTGDFDLLVSDRPADISSFDYLNVTFERARVFPADMESDNETENKTTENETETDTNTTENATEEMENETDSEGFREIAINDSTVDLTGVVGEYAKSVANTELEAGTYSKIELYSSGIKASVNGSNVDVKIPPGKLMITKPFNVSENRTTEFVFDIQVTLRGNQQNNQGYILKPVISQSGVAGEDVEMKRGTNKTSKERGNNTESEEIARPGGGTPESAGPGSSQ